MENQTKKLINAAKKSKAGIIALKNCAVTCKLYELASEFRGLELKLFPLTEEEKEVKKTCENLNLLFRMVDLQIGEKESWIIFQTIQKFNQKKGNFDIKEASKILARAEEIFENQ